ncbi:hypothetical protein WJX73_005848 [Symbiochloris irregularis]|uniref:Strawberry notch helicase C domain-containing protein n=1 Tax=Symbiochloris irregularis TaxID=706552 RepID=A0AAW1NQ22_9CHLO
MELVAMDMKAQGMYLCRTLSFAGTEFEMVEAALEPEMVEMHMCMASKVPCLVRMSQQAIAEGKCVVIGLQSTGEARTADAVAKQGEDLDDFISSPKELLLKLIQDLFPVPPTHGSQDARHELELRKSEMIQTVQELRLPSNPLDELIDLLGGPAQVAEMTGRKARLIRQKGSDRVVLESRNATGVVEGSPMDMINVHERGLFLSGQKLIAIISDAASAGISLHSDRRVQNQRRRVHITLELPWSADKTLQQFGRSHRANQANAPQYRLLFTPLGGERRFASAVARRLEMLGALTQGDRRATAGPSLGQFNYESTWGQRALRAMYAVIMETSKAVSVFVLSVLHAQSAGEIKDRIDVPRFLNRLLGLKPAAQAQLFTVYQDYLEATIAAARREGVFDAGITSIRGRSLTLPEAPKASNAHSLMFASD